MLLQAILAAAIGLPAAIHGDFDHDGRPDRAAVVTRPAGGYALTVWRGAEPNRPLVVMTLRDVRNFYLDKARPGRWRTACGKGYDLGGPCGRKSVLLRGDTLEFGTAEASEAVALWNGRRFEVVWISD